MAGIQYHNPPGLLAGTVILWFLATSSVALRFYSRRWKRQRFIISDWLILASSVFGTGLSVLEIYAIATGALGTPIGGSLEDPATVSDRLNRSKYVEFSFLLLGVVGLGLLKLSVCFLYWEIFGQVRFRRVLIVWMVVIVGWTLAFFIQLFAECDSHFSALWAQVADYTKYCQAAIPGGWAQVGADVATDVITLIIPIPVILNVQMSRHVKVLTLLIFSIGTLSVAASTVKAYIYISATLNRYSDDALLTLTGVSIWNLAEIHIGTMAACGPTLRSILVNIVPTQSAVSLLNSWRRPSRQAASEQSSNYAKMGASEERLGAGATMKDQSDVEAEAGISSKRLDSYELQPRVD
ncbi:hypothetical protein F4861DRAFT_540218 [Xylaria intraflava]|nr:hypothetical protein F4861DRAFT_540218 [Xylaria intraflava]